LLVAGRLRAMSEKLKAVTLPTFISNRFDDKSGVIKIVSTLVILFFFTLYVASGLKGGTLLFAHTFGATESLSPRSSSRSCWIAAVPRARRIGISWMAVSLIMATAIGIIGIGVHAAVFFQHSFEANLEAAWEGEASHFFDALRGELELVSAALVVRGS
ncbi:MAG: sodium:solute symporter family transporter, partial [Spirochaetota bacterium]